MRPSRYERGVMLSDTAFIESGSGCCVAISDSVDVEPPEMQLSFGFASGRFTP